MFGVFPFLFYSVLEYSCFYFIHGYIGGNVLTMNFIYCKILGHV